MHIFHTDDPEGEGHYPRYEVPPDFSRDDVEVVGKKEVEMDYPDDQGLDEGQYLDTYTGKAYEGKRGLMIHLGQMAGQHNIPEDIAERHDPEEYSKVETDEKGNITEVLRYPDGSVPPIEPYLPWYTEEDSGYVKRSKIVEMIKIAKQSDTGVISANKLQEELGIELE
jgi:hypothetical protein